VSGWPDDTSHDPVPGGVGELRRNGGNPQSATVVPMTVPSDNGPA
jgi:hypothetical protein